MVSHRGFDTCPSFVYVTLVATGSMTRKRVSVPVAPAAGVVNPAAVEKSLRRRSDPPPRPPHSRRPRWCRPRRTRTCPSRAHVRHADASTRRRYRAQSPRVVVSIDGEISDVKNRHLWYELIISLVFPKTLRFRSDSTKYCECFFRVTLLFIHAYP